MNNIQIIHKISAEEPFLIINKPYGLASAPISIEDKNNVVSKAIEMFPELKNVKGKKEIEYGLLHRLDTVTDGLIMIAANQKFYDYMNEQQKSNKFTKKYTAVCSLNYKNAELLNGFPKVEKIDFQAGKIIQITSMFRPYGIGNKEVRPVTENSNLAAKKKVGKQVFYNTEVKIISIKKDKVFVECKITNGFRHQVRSHLAWIGLPIINDKNYNYESLGCNEKIEFTASGLEFYYPEGDLNSYVL